MTRVGFVVMHTTQPPVPPVHDEITSREAVEILGFTNLSTISRYVGYGKLTPSRRLSTGQLMFWRADVQRLADEQTGHTS